MSKKKSKTNIPVPEKEEDTEINKMMMMLAKSQLDSNKKIDKLTEAIWDINKAIEWIVVDKVPDDAKISVWWTTTKQSKTLYVLRLEHMRWSNEFSFNWNKFKSNEEAHAAGMKSWKRFKIATEFVPMPSIPAELQNNSIRSTARTMGPST